MPMSDADFAELLESVREGGRILRGEETSGGRAWTVAADGTATPVPPATIAARLRAARAEVDGSRATPDARAIRERLGLSQEAFARVLDVPVATLRNWEYGRRTPRGPARQLLRVAAVAPEVLDVLARA